MDVLSSKISAADLTATPTQPVKFAEVKPVEELNPQKSVVSPAKTLDDVAPEIVQQELEAINSQLDLQSQGILFAVDKTTNSSVLKLVDKSTDEVIKQFPSEDSLRIMQNIQKYLDSANDKFLAGKEGLTGSLLNGII